MHEMSRKKKCDGKRPCEGCTKAGSECQYAKQADDNIAFIPFESVNEDQAMGFQRSDPTPNHGTPSLPSSSRKRSWTDGGYGLNRASPHDLAKSLPPISSDRSRPPMNSLPSITAFDTMPSVEEDSSSVLRRLGMD
ncbi:hypothetical protein Clacol_008806 [Clathrus columnatus]|uniref:Zn(2)-C6 fungal-type domain-containing protein n=1 Tax=Clathrus columnatus TaxID=1419009 RepID=A0AAV5AQ80_9AGAM|nr:hypothetical protein Clacol_008806 [Clathrus columnatus]